MASRSISIPCLAFYPSVSRGPEYSAIHFPHPSIPLGARNVYKETRRPPPQPLPSITVVVRWLWSVEESPLLILILVIINVIMYR